MQKGGGWNKNCLADAEDASRCNCGYLEETLGMMQGASRWAMTDLLVEKGKKVKISASGNEQQL